MKRKADSEGMSFMQPQQVLSKQILAKTREFGASLAGLVPLSALREPTEHLTRRGRIPADRASLLVLALEHPESEPELDWWGGEGGTEGNRRLISVSRQLQHFLTEELEVKARLLPYHPWKGGVLLKDAAALAGLGCIGDNNLLITPQYGTRVRLRALLVDLEVKPEPGSDFAPCATCPHPCWQACPQDAFASGAYAKAACTRQMALDEANAVAGRVSYCRACELACPIGR
jgi:epoxyqueuosine reductase